MQAHGFRVYFTPLFEVLFTFPSRYWFTIGLRRVFSLGGWSRLFHARFLVSRVTQDADRLRQKVAYGIITLYDAPFQDTSAFLISCHVSVLQPRYCRNNIGLGCSRFARHYFGNHYCFLLLWVLRCFSSPRSPSMLMEWYNLLVPGCPIRISADRFVFANPRGFSQLITSFFAFQSLGIPHVPLFTFFSPSGSTLKELLLLLQPGLINTSV